MLWSSTTRVSRQRDLPTRLTQDHKREARGLPVVARQVLPPRPESFCKDCGVEIGRGRTYCAPCAIDRNTVGLIDAAKRGRAAAQSDQAQAFRAESQRRHGAAKAAWSPSDLPAWLNKDAYIREIQPKLKGLTLCVLASTLGISIPYAVSVRNGKRIPHPRHWKKLALLVNAVPGN